MIYEEKDMRVIEGGVCAAKGFTANGIHCGIRKNHSKKDLALIFSCVPARAAAVYTTKSMSFVMFSARWPISTRIPCASNSFVKSLSCQSEPETVKPRLARSLARPLMLMPPIPMK